ncbi:MAG: hypothetical protein VB071_12325, partial [Lawsonibacter sp.]|nr:hypothetical protein [Lawsonibacter sp.]
LKQELEQSAPQEGGELLALVRKAALPLLGDFTSYRELVAALPRERTPMKEILSSPDVSAKFSRVDKDVLNDIRVKAMVDGYIKAACQQEHRKGKERVELTKGVYRDLHRAVREWCWSSFKRIPATRPKWPGTPCCPCCCTCSVPTARPPGRCRAGVIC